MLLDDHNRPLNVIFYIFLLKFNLNKNKIVPIDEEELLNFRFPDDLNLGIDSTAFFIKYFYLMLRKILKH